MHAEIQRSFRLLVEYAASLVDDIPADQFAVQPAGVRNHPAWIIGHLCGSFQAIGTEIGLSPWLPGDWSARFGTGTAPTPGAAAYPPKRELVDSLRDSASRIDAALGSLPAELLAADLPDKEYREVLPTIGDALIHILIGHASIHVGQLTSWRAVMGLPHVGERFDRE